MIDYDVIMENVGGLSAVQILLILYLSYGSVTSGFVAVGPVFLNYQPDFRCDVVLPGNWSHANLTDDVILNATTPYDDVTKKYDGCRRYNYSGAASCVDDVFNCFDHTSAPISCTSGHYIYHRDVMKSSAVTKFNLFCGDKSSISTFIYLSAMLFGSLFFGYLSDRFGRIFTIRISILVVLAFSIASVFSPSFWFYTMFRAGVSFGDTGLYVTSIIYLMEIVSTRWRTGAGMFFQVFFGLGYSLLSLIAYLHNDFFSIELVWTLMYCPLFLLIPFLPESPRWLFSVRKVERGIKATNKVFPKFDFQQEISDDGSTKDKVNENLLLENERYSAKDLFRKGILGITLKINFLWLATVLLYYAVTYNVSSLTGNIFINNAINGSMEVISYVFALLIDKTGRKPIISFFLFTSAFGLVAVTVIDKYTTAYAWEMVSLVISFVVKFSSSGAYAVIYNYTCELYPTVIRNIGLGVGNTTAHLGATLVPFLLAIPISWIYLTILASVAVISAFIVLSLPETKGVNMVDTIDDAIMFYNKGKHAIKQQEYERLN